MSFIHKLRGGVLSVGGFMSTRTSSLNTVNVASILTVQNAVITTAPDGASRWTGFTSIASGDSSVVVSAADVASGFPVIAGGITTVASHIDLVVSVTSVVDNTSFTIQVQNAVISAFDVAYIITV